MKLQKQKDLLESARREDLVDHQSTSSQDLTHQYPIFLQWPWKSQVYLEASNQEMKAWRSEHVGIIVATINSSPWIKETGRKRKAGSASRDEGWSTD